MSIRRHEEVFQQGLLISVEVLQMLDYLVPRQVRDIHGLRYKVLVKVQPQIFQTRGT